MSFTTDHGDGGGDAANMEEMEYVIKMRGCPWATTVEDVVEFFGG